MLSVGQLVPAGQALAWRGPMASGALAQLIDGDWGDAELLLVDLPPGTGDVQLSLVQKARPDGAVIVSTPQDLALIDATRAIDLFGKTGVPVLGLIENMAGYACPHCGETSDPFGSGGAEASGAASWASPSSAACRLSASLRKASDAGRPPAGERRPRRRRLRRARAARCSASWRQSPPEALDAARGDEHAADRVTRISPNCCRTRGPSRWSARRTVPAAPASA